jgi:DNA-binding transcriptional ArsR family regulator
MKWIFNSTHPPCHQTFLRNEAVRSAVTGRLTPFLWLMTCHLATQRIADPQTASMVRDPFAPDAPDLQDILDALDDPDCRTIIKHLEEPMTAKELSDACDIPLSTMYRKLNLLSDASLLEERIEIRTAGKHITRYFVAFDEVRIALADDSSFDVAIKRRVQTPEERLSEMWSEVRKQT